MGGFAEQDDPDAGWGAVHASLNRYAEQGGAANLAAAIDALRGHAEPGGEEHGALANLTLGILLLLRIMPEGMMTLGEPDAASALRLFSDWTPLKDDAARGDLKEGIFRLRRGLDDDHLPAGARPLGRMCLGTALMLRAGLGMEGTDASADFGQALSLIREAQSAGSLPDSIAGIRPHGLLQTLTGLTAGKLAADERERGIDPAIVRARLETSLDALGKAQAELADHAFGAFVASELGATLAQRAVITGQVNDLDKAWKQVSDALAEMDRSDHLLHGHPVHDDVLRTLAGLAVSNAAYTFEPARIDELVELSARVRKRTVSSDPRVKARDDFLAGMIWMLRSLRDGSRADESVAIEHLRKAAEGIHPDDDLALSVVGVLGALLFDRHGRKGGFDDAAAAGLYFETAARVLREREDGERGLGSLEEVAVLGLGTYVRVVRGWRVRDADLVEAALADLRPLAAGLPDDHAWRAVVRTALGIGTIARAVLRRESEGIGVGAGILAEEAERAAAGVSEGSMPGRMAALVADTAGRLMRGGGALAAWAIISDDGPRLDRAIELIELSLDERLAAGHPAPATPARLHWALAVARLVRRDRLRGLGQDAQDDLWSALASLERARELTDGHPGDPARAAVLQRLARLYREIGDTDRATDAGMAAMRAHGQDVLVQSDPESALTVARGAAPLARAMAAWCLAVGRHEDAVAALELGRGLVLHVATETRTLPEVLKPIRPDLAERWQVELASAPSTAAWENNGEETPATELLGELLQSEPPNDLRSQTVEVLNDQVRTAPSIESIARALRLVDTDALAYLIRDPDGTAGALVIRATGTTSWVPLPALKDDGAGTLAEFVSAADAVRMATADDAAVARRDAAIGALCGWAGAAFRPLLDEVLGWGLAGTPRLTLVPYGDLGLVPWHAATLGADGRRVVLHEAVITYAVSARQLIDVAGRRGPDPDAPRVFVANPSGDHFFWNARAVGGLVKHYYPSAVRYGRPRGTADGAGTPDEVLSWLPGGTRSPVASVLHFGCHAAAIQPAARSYLELAGGKRLEVRRILHLARNRRPGKPGGLIILCACSSDHARQDYDEALTPATALLESGAATVIGARWEVFDRPTALLIFTFHHHLHEGHAPAEALRLAQLWMLDRQRRPPPTMPPMLADESASDDLANPATWGAFVLLGAPSPAIPEEHDPR
ncbi:CHAT domain-containing protein [Actinomadura pelletieri DSM 43383]|uniref:CHAT domain-containing protein n=1 Tax=Actinomadura pelletieri DSM 43383 TaxID=1120940 RepID=A0A495QUM6_9ACTN|nr:CHAT domain-containing protein [Actinomadura pelletieri]RKS77158.1 CHAT domain-containing protein [Actinomadura pelletieri DSM 43383]